MLYHHDLKFVKIIVAGYLCLCCIYMELKIIHTYDIITISWQNKVGTTPQSSSNSEVQPKTWVVRLFLFFFYSLIPFTHRIHHYVQLHSVSTSWNSLIIVTKYFEIAQCELHYFAEQKVQYTACSFLNVNRHLQPSIVMPYPCVKRSSYLIKRLKRMQYERLITDFLYKRVSIRILYQRWQVKWRRKK